MSKHNELNKNVAGAIENAIYDKTENTIYDVIVNATFGIAYDETEDATNNEILEVTWYSTSDAAYEFFESDI
jgi:hypothetical protein